MGLDSTTDTEPEMVGGGGDGGQTEEGKLFDGGGGWREREREG